MNFFEGPITSCTTSEPPARPLALGAYEPAEEEESAPRDRFVPARLSRVVEIGAGPDVRIMLTGWEIWPGSVTMQLSVFLRQIPPGGRWGADGPGPGALRCGLLLADGRKVTTLDAAPWPTAGRSGPTLRLSGGSGGAFHYQMALHLSQLPPAGPTRLVVEWPDEQVPETATDIDATALRHLAGEALEIWPDAGSQAPAADGPEVRSFLGVGFGPSEIMAPAPYPEPPGPWTPPAADPSRADWEGMRHDHWLDADLVRARLANGADPDATDPDNRATPLHLAAAHGSPEAVAALLARTADADARDDEGCTPLWHAVCHGAQANAALLLEAGADAWRSQLGGRSPGRLALTTALAPLFAGLPGAVPLTDEERAAQRDADERIAVFRGVGTEGLSVAFVLGIDEDEAVRRLGGDPRNSPVRDVDAEPGPDGTDLYGFDPYDVDEAERWVGVTGVNGGCVLIQPSWYGMSTDAVLNALSPGTTAYGVSFNPKGGTFGTFSRNGRTALGEEIGKPGHHSGSPEGHWLYRFWDWDVPEDMWGADVLAYASAMAGLRLTDAAAVDGPPRRWVEIPENSPLLE
ncbi:ankyrin repeat domain-containing protein [Streptomyces gilvosporeus]|uniref:Uncharacterized protein n=1 Tax=Streptomyces gilvosporeus TaxID=553510 RepID=A0A1V0TXI9_9ACTN|nr:ankyrin repeat domain-containing protein [Streptomyces gilvosporeus]ARF57621.1 hypothetical protein B1H19_28575 [Streptomyces gilvosporeus]